MTTHTPSSTTSIDVFPKHRLNSINRNIYSGFTEHMGRCIYGGIYDPDNSNKDLIDQNGFRLDVIEALKPLKIPVFRYPGKEIWTSVRALTDETDAVQGGISVRHIIGKMALDLENSGPLFQNWPGVLSKPTSSALTSS